MEMGLIFKNDQGLSDSIDPNSYLLFIDETGDEHLIDMNYPVFGLGGCGIICKDYLEIISIPWQYMKQKQFNGLNTLLHAAELRQPSQEQLKALNEFFKNSLFSRFAVTLSKNVKNNTSLNIYQLLASSLHNRIIDIIKWNDSNSITMIFEKSERGDKLAEKYFNNFVLNLHNESGSSEIPISRYFMDKKANEPGLEIADFIMHAAGTQTRNDINLDKSKPKRKDFQVSFCSINNKLSSFLHITSAEQK